MDLETIKKCNFMESVVNMNMGLIIVFLAVNKVLYQQKVKILTDSFICVLLILPSSSSTSTSTEQQKLSSIISILSSNPPIPAGIVVFGWFNCCQQYHPHTINSANSLKTNLLYTSFVLGLIVLNILPVIIIISNKQQVTNVLLTVF